MLAQFSFYKEPLAVSLEVKGEGRGGSFAFIGTSLSCWLVDAANGCLFSH